MKKTIKTILSAVLTAVTGFCLMAFPFHIFDFLTTQQMKVIFVAELIIYFLIFAAAGTAFEARRDRKRKSKEMQKKHNERVEKRKRQFQGINITDFDYVA